VTFISPQSTLGQEHRKAVTLLVRNLLWNTDRVKRAFN